MDIDADKTDDVTTTFAANPYDNSISIDLTRTSDFEGFDKASKSLAKALSVDGKASLVEKHIRMWLVQLSRCHRWDTDGYIAYSRDSNSWVSRSTGKISKRGKTQLKPQGGLSLNPLGYSYMAVDVLDALEAAGFIEGKKGFSDRVSGKSRTARAKATEKLIDDYLKHFDLLTAVTKRHDKAPLVVLKDKDKNQIHYKKTVKTRKMVEGIEVYNRLLRDTVISLPDNSSSGLLLDQQQVYRVFNNNSFKQGGRYTGAWWMIGCNSNQRRDITINGEATTELDYQAQHLYMLYGLKGISYMEEHPGVDPYDLGDDCPHDRKTIKKSILTAVNVSGGMPEAWKAMNHGHHKDWRKEVRIRTKADLPFEAFVPLQYPDYIDLMGYFETRHPLLKDDLHTGIGIKLQNLDSMIAEIIINTLTSKNIPVLSVHDSFIVRGRDSDVLEQTMISAYEQAGISNHQSPVVKK